MDFKLVNRLLSKLTLAMCGVLIIPLLAALYADREHIWIFGFSLIASVTVASFLNLYASERARQRLRVREAIAVVGCGWLLVCFLGSIPYLLFNPADPLAFQASRQLVLQPHAPLMTIHLVFWFGVA